MERDMTLKDYLLLLLRKAKLIVTMMTVIGLLTSTLCVYTVYRTPTKDADKEKTETHDAEVKRVEHELESAVFYVQEMEEYIENSLYYQLNPYHKGVSRLIFLVDAKHRDGKEASVLTAQAYSFMYQGDAEIQSILQQEFGDSSDEYLYELIKVSYEGDNTVRIEIQADRPDKASSIAHRVFDTLNQKVNQTIVEHKVQLIADYEGYEFDKDLLAHQNSLDTALAANRKVITEKEAALKSLKNTKTSISHVIRTDYIKSGILGFSIGAVGGLVLGYAIVFCRMALKGKLYSAKAYEDTLSCAVLCVLPQSRQKRWFDKTIRRLEGENSLSYEDAVKLARATLCAIAGEQKIGVVSTQEKSSVQAITDSLQMDLLVCGNVLCDATAVEALKQADCVIRLEKRGEGNSKDLLKEEAFLSATGKACIGTVLY